MRMRICDRHMMVTETSKTTNFQTHFFYNKLANLLIDINFFYWQVFSGNQQSNQP